jgi:hypothetical protein
MVRNPSPGALTRADLSPPGRGEGEAVPNGVKPSFVKASMPPASKKFLANVARAVNSASVPRLARKIFGRAPVWSRIRSDMSRRRSNGSASRIGLSGG